jgi:transposase
VKLEQASREELLAIIAAQQEQIGGLEEQVGQLTQQVAEVTARLRGGGGKSFPGLKPQQAKSAERPARKKRPRGFARRRMEPTERVEHAMEACPDCGCRLLGGSVKRRREVLELPVAPVRVIEHVYLERCCPLCRKRWTPRPELDGVVAGRQRLGVDLVSRIAVLREEARLPFAAIQRRLASGHGLHLSRGALVGAVRRVAERGQAALATIREEIRTSPRVHADETGWRENGRNGYVWTFSTPRQCYFLRRGRHKAVVAEVLGESFDGVLVSDFYAAYTTYPGVHQYCWAHLLRDIHDLKVHWPDAGALHTWAAAVHTLFEEARDWARQATAANAPEAVRAAAQEQCEGRLRRLCRPFQNDPAAPQHKLCQRIFRHLKELFVFVGLPDVPPDNNSAERSLRPLVVARKISGGTRSPGGSESKMTLASLFATWRLQGLDPLLQCRLLLSPQS